MFMSKPRRSRGAQAREHKPDREDKVRQAAAVGDSPRAKSSLLATPPAAAIGDTRTRDGGEGGVELHHPLTLMLSSAFV